MIIYSFLKANAWDFVQHLDNGIDTFIGTIGSHLSGKLEK